MIRHQVPDSLLELKFAWESAILLAPRFHLLFKLLAAVGAAIGRIPLAHHERKPRVAQVLATGFAIGRRGSGRMYRRKPIGYFWPDDERAVASMRCAKRIHLVRIDI